MTRPSPVVVTGMHRSGTSLVASLVADLGVGMGERQLAADRNNRRGYFEDVDFLALDRRMLEAASASGDGGHPDWGWTESERLDRQAFAGFRDEAEALVAARARTGDPWGWKDPRTTLALDFWSSLLDDARYVFVYRHPWAVADSMQRLGADVFLRHPEYAYRIWSFYNRQLLEFHRRHRDRSLLISAEALVGRPDRLAGLLRERLGLELGEGSSSEVVDADLIASWGVKDPLPPLVAAVHPECVALLGELDRAADLSGAGHWSTRSSSRFTAPASGSARLSVVIPCYDQGELLIEAVASVERSVEEACELIVVNDGSRQPRTLEVLDRLRRAGYRIVDQANAGLAAARNRGVALAAGSYVLPLDADNRLRPGFVPAALAILEAAPEVGVVYGNRHDFGLRNGTVEVPDFNLASLLLFNTIDACALLRKEMWSACGGYDPRAPAWEDWELWIAGAERGWLLRHLPVVGFDYRVRPGSMITAVDDEERRRLYAYIIAKHRDLYGSRLPEILIEAQRSAADLLSLRRGRESSEAAIRAEYESVVEGMAAQLGEFDARIRQLGSEIELRHAARQREVAGLGGELAQQRSKGESLAARREELESSLAERDRQAEELRSTLEEARAGLDWSYRRWQAREGELEAIRRSKMWRFWMAYQAARRAILAPLRLARRLPRIAARSARSLSSLARRATARGLGWLYLATWTAGAWLISIRRRGRLPPAPGGEPTAVSPAELGRRPRILVVCPYPLYPADHGGGVRIYNLVRRLSRHCDLHLLVFIPADDDPPQRQALEPWVEKLYFHHWRPRFQPDLWGLKPPGVQLFEAPEVRALIAGILSRERIDVLQLEYTELGQYGLPRFARVKVVLSEIDISFRSRARRRRAGLHRRYALDRNFGHSRTDWMRQFRYELQVARRADQVHVMSSTDGAYLARFLPDGWRRIRVVPNAVALDDHRPPAAGAPRSRRLLFVGNFEHLPNLDALDYLLGDLWPRIRRRVPDAELVVVGARAGPSVCGYDGRDGVTVVGAVPETRPYFQECRALVAPIRAGSGTRLKVLEALACATPVLTTTIGAEGIEGVPGRHFLIADAAADLVEGACRLLEDDELCARLGREGRDLVERRYGWEASAAAALAGYAGLLDRSASGERSAWEPPVLIPAGSPAKDEVDVSIVIPTLHGGAVLERCLAAVGRQRTDRSVEVLCVDSGSSAADLTAMERGGARVIHVERSQFNHGLTRDLGAAASRGRVLVFLNQDAVPCEPDWLDQLTAPLFAAADCVAVQGAIVEVPDRERRFYWDSCGDRFYFTRETRRWLERYFGIGFSTVNAAIRRDVWERHPFGYAPILEDKKWQREVVAAGHGIAVAPRAAVAHTHNYDMGSLARRCESEGFGWRTLGETYSLSDLLADVLRPRIYADLLRGLARGQIRSRAELCFPFLRPWLLFRGNRWGKALRA
ncbi:MAG TPA: glycosyltransferase [Thermoanaerobaculia bacterium]